MHNPIFVNEVEAKLIINIRNVFIAFKHDNN
jgi:hypothetical protein